MAWSHIKSIVYSEEITRCEQLKEKIIVAFYTLKRSNTLESVHRNLLEKQKYVFDRMGNIFSNFCNNKLYDYFILFRYVFLIFRYGKNKLKLRQYPLRQRSTVRSVVTRRDKVHAYRAKIHSRFSRKQSLKRKIFILYFRLLFSRRITPFSLVPPVTNHPVYAILYNNLFIESNDLRRFQCHVPFLDRCISLFIVK